MDFYWLAVGILCGWRITHLLNAEDGPWDILVRFRQWVGEGFWAKLLDCFYCLSVWISLPLAIMIGQDWTERLLLWPALSAGTILLENIMSRISREDSVLPAAYVEDPEDEHGLLWGKAETTAESKPAAGNS